MFFAGLLVGGFIGVLVGACLAAYLRGVATSREKAEAIRLQRELIRERKRWKRIMRDVGGT